MDSGKYPIYGISHAVCLYMYIYICRYNADARVCITSICMYTRDITQVDIGIREQDARTTHVCVRVCIFCPIMMHTCVCCVRYYYARQYHQKYQGVPGARVMLDSNYSQVASNAARALRVVKPHIAA